MNSWKNKAKRQDFPPILNILFGDQDSPDRLMKIWLRAAGLFHRIILKKVPARPSIRKNICTLRVKCLYDKRTRSGLR
ncbi:MAG: hypothetical protein AAF824_18695 [Bacteroidota bacterium]